MVVVSKGYRHALLGHELMIPEPPDGGGGRFYRGFAGRLTSVGLQRTLRPR